MLLDVIDLDGNPIHGDLVLARLDALITEVLQQRPQAVLLTQDGLDHAVLASVLAREGVMLGPGPTPPPPQRQPPRQRDGKLIEGGDHDA